MTLLWDVRTAMEEKEARDLESIIAKNKSKTSYFILKHSNWINHDCTEMKTTYMLRSTKPEKMLGTVLWLIDNKKGSVERIWDLPLDVIVPPEYIDQHHVQEHVAKSAESIAPAIQVSGTII